MYAYYMYNQVSSAVVNYSIFPSIFIKVINVPSFFHHFYIRHMLVMLLTVKYSQLYCPHVVDLHNFNLQHSRPLII